MNWIIMLLPLDGTRYNVEKHLRFWDGDDWNPDMHKAKVYSDDQKNKLGLPIYGCWLALPEVAHD